MADLKIGPYGRIDSAGRVAALSFVESENR